MQRNPHLPLTIKPEPYPEDKIKRVPKAPPVKEKMKRPPAVYSNPSWEDTIAKYETVQVEVIGKKGGKK